MVPPHQARALHHRHAASRSTRVTTTTREDEDLFVRQVDKGVHYQRAGRRAATCVVKLEIQLVALSSACASCIRPRCRRGNDSARPRAADGVASPSAAAAGDLEPNARRRTALTHTRAAVESVRSLCARVSAERTGRSRSGRHGSQGLLSVVDQRTRYNLTPMDINYMLSFVTLGGPRDTSSFINSAWTDDRFSPCASVVLPSL